MTVSSFKKMKTMNQTTPLLLLFYADSIVVQFSTFYTVLDAADRFFFFFLDPGAPFCSLFLLKRKVTKVMAAATLEALLAKWEEERNSTRVSSFPISFLASHTPC